MNHLPGYAAFMFRLFFRAQYNAKMAPLIKEMPSTPNAIPDIHVVAHPLAAGSVLKMWEDKNQRTINGTSVEVTNK